MNFRNPLRISLVAVAALLLAGCASMMRVDPLQFTVAGIEPLQGEGLELRMLVKLRVQNPNDAPLAYDGVYLKFDVLGKTFATGVSDASGTVPRFGETVIEVPVTVSVLRMVRHALGMLDGQPMEKVTYSLSGKLNGPIFAVARFTSAGEIDLRTVATPTPDAGSL
ncbi:MAG: LEA type 2 family protein [Steroidobacteraceae bacterium]